MNFSTISQKSEKFSGGHRRLEGTGRIFNDPTGAYPPAFLLNSGKAFLFSFLGAVGLRGDSLLLSPVVEPVKVEGKGWDSDDFSFLDVWEAVSHFESFDFAE